MNSGALGVAKLREVQRRLWDGGWALLPLRLILGFGFVAHGYAKLSHGPQHFAEILALLSVPAPVPMAWATIVVELCGGILIMAGAWVIPTSVPLVVVMLTAMFSVHLPYGFSTIKLKGVVSAGAVFGPPGYEMNLLYIAGLLALTLGGSGALSIDKLRFDRRAKYKVAPARKRESPDSWSELSGRRVLARRELFYRSTSDYQWHYPIGVTRKHF